MNLKLFMSELYDNVLQEYFIMKVASYFDFKLKNHFAKGVVILKYTPCVYIIN